MKALLGRYSDFFFFLLRVVAAALFLIHGLQKFNIAMLGGAGALRGSSRSGSTRRRRGSFSVRTGQARGLVPICHASAGVAWDALRRIV